MEGVGGGCAEGGEDRGGGRGDPYSHIISIKPKTMTCRYNESLTFDIVVSDEGKKKGLCGHLFVGFTGTRRILTCEGVHRSTHRRNALMMEALGGARAPSLFWFDILKPHACMYLTSGHAVLHTLSGVSKW